jgi:hypothetical protein
MERQIPLRQCCDRGGRVPLGGRYAAMSMQTLGQCWSCKLLVIDEPKVVSQVRIYDLTIHLFPASIFTPDLG